MGIFTMTATETDIDKIETLVNASGAAEQQAKDELHREALAEWDAAKRKPHGTYSTELSPELETKIAKANDAFVNARHGAFRRHLPALTAMVDADREAVLEAGDRLLEAVRAAVEREQHIERISRSVGLAHHTRSEMLLDEVQRCLGTWRAIWGK